MPLTKQRGFNGLSLSILCDVFLLSLLLLSSLEAEGQSIEIVPGAFNEDDLVLKPIPGWTEATRDNLDRFEGTKRFDSYGDFSKTTHDTIHRILRDEDSSTFRADDQKITFRWKKSADPPMHRKVSKREIDMLLQENNSSSGNSTKSLDLVNSNLTRFVIDSDLELQIKQSDDRGLITRLNLTNNFVTEFTTKDLYPWLSSVRELDLSNNNLSRFVMNFKSELESIDLSGNHLFNFIIEANDTNLKTIYLQNNNLNVVVDNSASIFNIAAAKRLETLDLSCNQISKVDSKLIGNGRNLKRLNLSKNKLRRISKDVFNNLINIDTLVLSFNQIETINNETFLELPSLQYLDLSHNAIGAESIRSLQGIPDLVGLSIAYNPSLGDALQEFVASWSLKELDASGTGLCRIPSALAQSVRTLVLVDNWFEMIRCGDLDSYPLLQYLDLSHSHISDIEDDALGRLEMLQTLFLDHNNLKKIPVSLPTSLENLLLHNNDITDIQPQSLQQLTNLRTIDLSHNKLTYIPGLPLPKLQVLNLRFSQLRGLSQSVVKMSPKLRDLLLDGNPIKCTELMGIAEWASPCLNRENLGSSTSSLERDANNYDSKKPFIETHNYFSQFPSNWRKCPDPISVDLAVSKTRPRCADSMKKIVFDSNKIELILNGTDNKQLKIKKTALEAVHNCSEEIENSINSKPLRLELLKDLTKHEIQEGFNKTRIFSDNNTNHFIDKTVDSLANKQTASPRKLPNDTTSQLHDDHINISLHNSHFHLWNANNNQTSKSTNEQKTHLKDFPLLVAKIATTTRQISPTSDLKHSSLNATTHTVFSQLSKKSMRKRRPKSSMEHGKDDLSQKKIKPYSSTTSIPEDGISPHTTLSSSTIEYNEQFKLIQQGHQQISTSFNADKLALTLAAPWITTYTELGKEHPTIQTTVDPIADSDFHVRQAIKQPKMMMLASQSSVDGAIQEPTQKVSQTTFLERQNISNNQALHIAPVSGSMPNTSNISSLQAGTTTATRTKTMLNSQRIASKLLSSKVNKADKVVDHELLSPSAINENGIIKRNHSSVPYHSPVRTPPGGEEIVPPHTTTTVASKAHSLHQQTPTDQFISSLQPMNKNSLQHKQNISQQNQERSPALPLLYNKKLKPLEKVKDDRHLRFIGAKNLNLTVLTYNNKGHIHKTINKDIAPQSFQSLSTISPSQQLFSELGTSKVFAIDFQLTTPAPTSYSSPSSSEHHVKVNKNRIASESNNHQDNNNKQRAQGDGDVHPQLNALHALASMHLNTSANNATIHAGLPPERWLDIRTATGHPGLLIVIGLTIGIICTLGLLHIYRCRRPASCRKASQLHQLHELSSPHCCNRSGAVRGNLTGGLHEYSPGHFCRYSHNSIDDDAGYYIEPDQNRMRNATRRDFLPMELLKSSTSRNGAKVSNSGHHCPERRAHAIW